MAISSAYAVAGSPRGRLPDSVTTEAPLRAWPNPSRNRAHSAALISGPGSLNSATAPGPSAPWRPAPWPSTTVKVRRVSAATGVNAAGTASSRRPASTALPVAPPANPSKRVSAPSACRVRATFVPLPPGRA